LQSADLVSWLPGEFGQWTALMEDWSAVESGAKDAYILIPGTCEQIMLHGKKGIGLKWNYVCKSTDLKIRLP
jgi:hypothetical protein